MSRRAELAIDASRGQFAEQVFIQIPLRIALSQRQGFDHIDGRDQQRGLVDHQRGVFHVLVERILRPLIPRRIFHLSQLAKVRKDFVSNDLQHLLGICLLLQLAPTQMLFVTSEVNTGERFVFVLARPFFLFGALSHIQQPRKHQERNLFDDG